MSITECRNSHKMMNMNMKMKMMNKKSPPFGWNIKSPI